MTGPALTFGAWARLTGGRLVSGDPAASVPGLSIDSRMVWPGSIFIALKGDRRDGHDFVNEVLRSEGAGGAVVSRLPEGLRKDIPILLVADTVKALQDAARYHRESLSARVVGITGSNGKTTTKQMVSRLLSVGGKNVLATQGNYNSQIGLPLMVWGLSPSNTHAVFEMGASEKGNIASLASIAKPQVGVITNIGRAHIETFGSQDGVAEAKWELIASLPADGTAVLNADDRRLMERRPRSRARVVTFGLSEASEVRGEALRQTPQTVFTLAARGRRGDVRLPVPGLFNVYNALAAAAVALGEGVAWEDVVRGLESFEPPPQRMQVRRGKGGSVLVIDAYNANPDSMRASLESFSDAYAGKRRVAVLGGMRELGPSTADEHRALGALAGRLKLDKVFFLGEEGLWVREGWPPDASPRLELAADKAELGRALSRESGADAVFLFKASRGVKMEDVYEPLIEG